MNFREWLNEGKTLKKNSLGLETVIRKNPAYDWILTQVKPSKTIKSTATEQSFSAHNNIIKPQKIADQLRKFFFTNGKVTPSGGLLQYKVDIEKDGINEILRLDTFDHTIKFNGKANISYQWFDKRK